MTDGIRPFDYCAASRSSKILTKKVRSPTRNISSLDSPQTLTNRKFSSISRPLSVMGEIHLRHEIASIAAKISAIADCGLWIAD
jgi:hypothetical protein